MNVLNVWSKINFQNYPLQWYLYIQRCYPIIFETEVLNWYFISISVPLCLIPDHVAKLYEMIIRFLDRQGKKKEETTKSLGLFYLMKKL